MRPSLRFSGRREQSVVPFLLLGTVFYWLMTGVCALTAIAMFISDEEKRSDALLAIGSVVAFVTVFCCFGATCFTLHTIRECRSDQDDGEPLVLGAAAAEYDGTGVPLITPNSAGEDDGYE